MTGYVKAVVVDKGFGFIAASGSVDVFFHAGQLREGLTFDEQLVERYVEFGVERSARGMRAVDVRPGRD